ncbi:META domain-containing protein [uncultured Cetobacterium sp.]|uniref:META domain-containing protein n=1 Tax=uncultured Cetobacterium sp. TaxID=527638 RepID=UPI002609A70D|nr:META domain-containing protein [uncultured Cetobacterium sp.]
MKKIFGFLLVVTMLFGGCSTLTTSKKNLTGKEYVLVQENGIPNILIGFDGNNFYGFSGVNNYFGKYEKKGSDLTLERMGSTLMAGPEALMKMEQNYFNELSQVTSYKQTTDSLVLTLKSGKQLIFKENKK